MGIIFMSLNIVILLGIGIGVFIIYKKIREIQNHIEKTVDSVQNILKHPEDTAINMGASAAASAYQKVKNLISKKKSKE